MTPGSLQLSAGRGHGGGVGTGRITSPFESWALNGLVAAEGRGSWGPCWHLQTPKTEASGDIEEALGPRRILISVSAFGLPGCNPLSPFSAEVFYLPENRDPGVRASH